jgi:FlaG/FlaF family flagellin (archaellin)
VHLYGTASRSLPKSRRSQRGEGRLKTILFVAVVVILVFLAFKLVPPYVSEYQLTDKMQEQARFGVVNRYTDEQVRDAIFKVVQDLDIPAKREDIKVTATQSMVKVSLEYSVPVDLLVYSTELHFSPSSENKSLF